MLEIFFQIQCSVCVLKTSLLKEWTSHFYCAQLNFCYQVTHDVLSGPCAVTGLQNDPHVA